MLPQKMVLRNRSPFQSVAILATDGVEESELLKPVEALQQEGYHPVLVSPQAIFRAWKDGRWSKSYYSDQLLDQVDSSQFIGLVLPGGTLNADQLRTNPRVSVLVRRFWNEKKMIAAICHAPWLLIEANLVLGINLTSHRSIKTDLVNAGANWFDQPVVVDLGLVTSQKPSDLPLFNQKMIEELNEGLHHQRQTVRQNTRSSKK